MAGHGATQGERSTRLLEARLRLAQMAAGRSLHELLVATLDEICALTDSSVGFYHFLLPDQLTLSLQAWSTRTTREFCHAEADQQHYDIHKAGIWADCVRRRRTVVINDYAASPSRRGLPEGHAAIARLVSAPIFRDGRITAVIGVGNKPTPYDDDDVRAIEMLADLAWDLTAQRRAEDALAERGALVQRRYEALRALSDIAALPPGEANHQLEQALALGARHLDLPIGIVARVDDQDYMVVRHHAPAEAQLANGQHFALGDTYCAITLHARDVVAIPHMGDSPHAGHPCYQAFGLEAYLGAPVLIGDRSFGTINFSSPAPYHRDFDEGDLEFMRLLARWVGSVLERERVEAELRTAKEAAEQRSQELANSNSELEQFAYVASHDLRQPLRMVTSYLSLIERRLGDRLDDDIREFLHYAHDGAVQMDQLIVDLLDYSRVGRHGKPPEPVDLAQVAGHAQALLQVAAADCAGTIDLAGPPAAMVAGTLSELERLFQNLMGNGLKYHRPDQAPRVSAQWRRDGEWWEVSVADNGIGIPPEYREDIFKIFRRLHTSREYEGTGIGLAICQKIVKRHGGRLWVESEPGRGSVFRFTLPALAGGSNVRPQGAGGREGP